MVGPLLVSLLLPLAALVEVPQPLELPHADPMIVERVQEALGALEASGGPEQWGALANVYHAHGWVQEAAECYRKALEADSVNPVWWHQISLAHWSLGETGAALAANERVLRLAPDYASARVRRGYWNLTLARPEDAAADFSHALELEESKEAWAGLARARMEQGDRRGAAEILERLAVEHPSYGYGHLLRADVYRADGRTQDAVIAAAKGAGAQAAIPDPWEDLILEQRTGLSNILSRAAELLAEGRLPEALRALQDLQRTRPDDPLLLNRIGEVYLVGGRPDLALQAFEAAASSDQDPRTDLHVAQARAAAGDLQGAYAALDVALARRPGFWPALAERARLLHLEGRLDEARVAYREALANGGFKLPRVALGLADLLYQTGEWVEAEQQFAQLVRRHPDLAMAWAGWAGSLMELGRLDEARHALGVAGKIDPRNRTLRALEVRLRSLEAGDRLEEED